MAEFPRDSVDLVVTDPPYGLEFMGKEWDKTLPPMEAFEEVRRVLKPGALCFVMSSPRQDLMWRMMRLLEDAGFEMQQSFISWVYKTGFPKAYDVSKSIDKKLGLKREEIGKYQPPEMEGEWNLKQDDDETVTGSGGTFTASKRRTLGITAPASDLAREWDGWKSQTGLKPALEPILMVNKPLSEKTIVDNVLRWGTGAINVDACRIPFQKQDKPQPFAGNKRAGEEYGELSDIYDLSTDGTKRAFYEANQKGRFPANLLVSDGALDTGEITESTDRKKYVGKTYGSPNGRTYLSEKSQGLGYSDIGDQSRYFDLDAWAEHHGILDVAKPSSAERGEGNIHPTVKPIKLMAYLIELGCPKDGVVLDPFAGSGTTCIACKRLARKYIGIEIDPEYIEIARGRVNAIPKPLRWVFG